MSITAVVSGPACIDITVILQNPPDLCRSQTDKLNRDMKETTPAPLPAPPPPYFKSLMMALIFPILPTPSAVLFFIC